MAKSPFSYRRDLSQGPLQSQTGPLDSFHGGFPEKVSTSTAPQQPIDLLTHHKKDSKQIASRYHADCSLAIITAAPTGEVLTQRKSTDEAAGLCAFSQLKIGDVV